MIVGSIARRYAKALLEIGIDNKSSEALGKDLDRVATLVAQSDELQNALATPVLPLSQRKAVLEEVLKRLAVEPMVRNFLLLLLDRGRIGSLAAIAREYRTLVDEHAGRLHALVTSAKPLTPMLEARIRRALEHKTGKTVILEKREDPSLIGGVVAQIGDLVYDGSVRTQLDQVRHDLLVE